VSVPYSIFETEQGWVGLVATGDGLVRSVLPRKERESVERGLIVSRTTLDRLSRPDEDAVRLLAAYYRGEPVDLSTVALDFGGLPRFDRRVYEVLMGVGRGSVMSYGRAAACAGNPGAARAVGGAMLRNPLPPFIPCHRIVGSDGTMVGFSTEGGLSMKRRLLEMEGVRFRGDRVVDYVQTNHVTKK
jgi:methylated-DNA-[protein]-cysteine S-methyltransferase